MTTQPKGNHRRRRGMLKLNPATRAIRHALALGLAMAAAQPVFAGTCDVSIPSSAKCNGDFVDTTIQYGIDDLTLVVGGDLPTSIDPLDGARGIDLYSSYGAINLTSSADMLVTNASAIFVRSFYGDISIHNTSDGAVTASGTYSNATGIDAGTYYGSNVSIINDGLVDVTVVGYGNATGIRASNFYGNVDVSISDTGSISTSTDTVYGGTAVGVRANTVMGGASVSNAGDITTDATADAGYATAYGIIARGGYYNTTAITNTGDITSTAFSGDGVGWAWGVRARGTDVVVDNQGTISTDADAAYGYATAIATYARGYNSTTTNSGTLIADANVDGYGGAARAYGVMAWGTNASLDNSGTIDTRATIGYGTAVAFGALSYYADHAVQANSGTITSYAHADTGVTTAWGFRNEGYYSGSIDNAAGGHIQAVADTTEGYSFAYGAWVDTKSSVMTNAGDISASATSHESALGGAIAPRARAIGVNVQSGDGYDTTLINATGGDISASATVLEDGFAYAFAAVSYGSDSGRLENSGTMTAEAYAAAGYAVGAGSITVGQFSVSLNYGEMSGQAVVDGYGGAQAVGAYVIGEVGTFINEGDTHALASAGSGGALANGIQLYGNWLAAYNYATVAADATISSGDADAFGIRSYSVNGSTIVNAAGATIDANARAVVGNATARGIDNFAYVYGAYVTNDGAITADASGFEGYAQATGIANVAWLYGNSITTNTGAITSTATMDGDGSALAMGIYSYGFIYGPQVVNGGDIVASATAASGAASATGVGIAFYHGEALVQNDGTITATAITQGGQYGGAYAYGVVVDKEIGKYNFPNVSVVNHGDIVATASHAGDHGFAGAIGLRSVVTYATLANAGHIVANATATGVSGKAEAVGASTLSKYALDDTNDGSISATAVSHLGGSAYATGVSDTGFYTDATIRNHGDIAASAISIFDGAYGGTAKATALYAHANYSGIVDNAGSLVAQAGADHGTASATGLAMQAKYATATVANAGDIVAAAQANAGSAKAMGSTINSKYGAATYNNGVVDATAIADAGGSADATGSVTQTPGFHGYFSGSTGGVLYNGGAIQATAHADGGQAIATGSRVEGANDAASRTYNGGLIYAAADAAGGYAFATGSKTWGYYGNVVLANYGDIVARADGGQDGHALATGGILTSVSLGAYHAGVATLANDGTIAATAHGTIDATAIGVQMDAEMGVQASNNATISAVADGGTGLGQAAALVMASSAGDIAVANAGTIVADADGGTDGEAIGVHMTSYGTNALSNTGAIVASGTSATHTAIWSSDAAIATIDNQGLITGSLRTGAMDDMFTNAAGAAWNAEGLSDFGAGDDAITNAGLLRMADATISLGDGIAGNRFANTGAITVVGTNRIDMGLVGFAFDNRGTIDFRDGMTDDTLAIGGDFQGNGRLRMDVSGARGTSDMLMIEGNVAAGSVGTIDLDVLDMPTTANSAITLVQVDGDSSEASFQLGTVRYNQANFLSLDFDTRLTATLDASNARPDVFQLGVRVDGLNDTGTLAASIAPGAQRMMAAQVGTWRERMVDGARPGELGTWARLILDEGTVTPQVVVSNFGTAGRYGFDQKTSGTEVGIDFAINDQFRVGALMAKTDARQSLSTGVGSMRLDGDTAGVFATWHPVEGAYVDASYRRMRFDTRMDTDAGRFTSDGEAGTFNLEAGWGWLLGNGLLLEPQLQYTRTELDGMNTVRGGVSDFHADDGTSSTGRLGLLASKRFGTGTTWTPYASLNAVREYDGEYGYGVNNVFFGATSTEGTSTLAETGIEVRFKYNVSITGSLHWQDGGAWDGFFGGQMGVRFTW